MKELVVTREELKTLQPIQQIGAEATLYIKGDQVYKIYNSCIAPSKLSEREQKLNAMLSNSSILKIPNVNWPIKAIHINGTFAGITQPYLKDYTTLNNITHRNRELIRIFKQLSETLKQLHQHKIYFGDLNPKNLMYLKDRVQFVDVDGIRYKDYPVFSYSMLLQKYNIEGPSKLSDIFFLTYLALNALTDSAIISHNYSSLHDKIENLCLPDELSFFENVLFGFEELYISDYLPLLSAYQYDKSKNTFARRK